jgi:hypothetical protein
LIWTSCPGLPQHKITLLKPKDFSDERPKHI